MKIARNGLILKIYIYIYIFNNNSSKLTQNNRNIRYLFGEKRHGKRAMSDSDKQNCSPN